jgi:hypothetical protein
MPFLGERQQVQSLGGTTVYLKNETAFIDLRKKEVPSKVPSERERGHLKKLSRWVPP